MKHLLIVQLMIFCALSLCLSDVGEDFMAGYQFANLGAAMDIAKDMGLSAPNTNEIMGEMRPYIILNSFLRTGCFLSGGFSRIYGTPDQRVLSIGEAGTGFGDVKVGIMAEIYSPCRRWDRAFAFTAGYGALITFVQDSNCSNDGLRAFYYFIQPQFSLAYDLGNSIAMKVSAGYTFPFPINDDELWFVNEAGDTLRHTFNAGDIGGIFIKAGFTLGAIKKSEEKVYKRRKPKLPKWIPIGCGN